MAYTHASKFVDVHSIDELERRLSRVPAEAAKQVAKRNRQHANSLVRLIKAEEPVAGGVVKHRASWSHAKWGSASRTSGTRGTQRRSIRSKVGADYASVLGGGPTVPYWFASEFGGGARFTNKAGNEQYIPTRERSPSLKSKGLFDYTGKTQRGAVGWFFYPTAELYTPQIRVAIARDAEAIVRRELAGKL